MGRVGKVNVIRWMSVVVGAALLSGCGGPLANVEFDNSVPAEQQQFIRNDLNAMGKFSYEHRSTEAIPYLGNDDVSPGALGKFLSRRIHYIIGENVDIDRVKVAAESRVYRPNQTSNLRASVESNNSSVVMLNAGAYLYTVGRDSNTVYDFPINSKAVRILSPLTGIVQIGAGLFDPGIMRIATNTLGATILRIGTYFHEGYHGNGSGAWATFGHDVCVSGSFSGQNACDNATNGPYPFGAFIEKVLLSGCKECTNADQQAVKADISDGYSRVLTNTAKYVPPQPETL